MMRSMYSAVSSLRAHQLKMDTIGNNIANVNTVAFKGSSVTFKEVFNETLQGAGSAQDGRGGTNPMQVGLGADVASISVNHTKGATERTDKPTDVMIDGQGFFLVSDDRNFLNRSYTRAGNFILDDYGNLNTPSGMRVLGYKADENGNLGSTLEGLTIPKSATFEPQVSKEITLEGNLNSKTKDSSTFTPPLDGNFGDPSSGNYVYEQETKTVDGKTITYYKLNDDYKDCVGRETTIQAYDSLGGVHDIKLSFIKTAPNNWEVQSFYIKDDGNMYPFQNSLDLSTPSGSGATAIAFDSFGQIDSTGTTEINYQIQNPPNGASNLDFTVDLSDIIQFENQSNVSENTNDGYTQGTLDDFSIAPSGEIVGSFTNGKTRTLGKIALAKFKNPAGLKKTSNNLFKDTSNSGKAIIGVPGSSGFGATVSGRLEMSNVDLGKEFTNMITTQRGFQANSRVITTTDEMLQELVNLKR